MAERSLRHLLAVSGVNAQIIPPSANPLITHITLDSRKVGRGGLFVAVPGTQADGHDFVDAVRRQGAAAVVLERDFDGPVDMACVRVDHTAEAAAKLAAGFYGLRGPDAKPPKLVGITGTNGKSTTCLLVQAILQAAGHPTALLGTIRYDLLGERVPAPWTTPPAVELCEFMARAVQRGATHAVMEVSSHALDQHRCDGLRFDVAIFTNLTGDHLDYHLTQENYAAAKTRLFRNLTHDAFAVVNAEDAACGTMIAGCPARILRYGLEGNVLEARAVECRRQENNARTLFDLFLPDRPSQSGSNSISTIRIRSRLVGRHNISNMLAAATAAKALGVPDEAIRTGLESVTIVPGRLQRVEPEGHPFAVFVDYAHSDDSLSRALAAVRPLTQGRLICVFGCGGNRDRLKRPRMAAAVAQAADLAILTSDNPRWEDPKTIIAEARAGFDDSGRSRVCELRIEVDRRSAIEQAVTMAQPGDTVLIAGKGHEDYQEIRGERHPFDDVVVAGEYLKGSKYDPVRVG